MPTYSSPILGSQMVTRTRSGRCSAHGRQQDASNHKGTTSLAVVRVITVDPYVYGSAQHEPRDLWPLVCQCWRYNRFHAWERIKMSYNMDGYVQVVDRIKLFYARYPEGSLQMGTPTFIDIGEQEMGTWVALMLTGHQTDQSVQVWAQRGRSYLEQRTSRGAARSRTWKRQPGVALSAHSA